MNHSLIMLGLCSVVLLSGCDAMQQNASRAGDGIQSNYDRTRQKLSHYIYNEPEPSYQHRPYETPVFCYRLMMDTQCFDRPKPEMHQKLVAVQGIHPYDYEDFIPAKVLDEQGLSQERPALAYPQPTSYAMPDNNPYIAPQKGDIITSEVGAPARIMTDSGLKPTPFYGGQSPTAVSSPPPVAAVPDTSTTVPVRLMK